MDIVRLLVPADGAHVRVEPLPRGEAVFLQRVALPLGEGVDDFRLPAVLVPDVEGHRALHAVQIVVEAGLRIHHEGRGHTQEVQPLRQKGLEEVLHALDGHLGVVQVQAGLVVFWECIA